MRRPSNHIASRTGAPALALIAVAVLLIVGCGSMSADEYRGELEAACADVDDTIRNLPQRQADEDLTTDEVKEIADEAGADYADEVESFDPPSELAGEHDELVSLIDDPLPEDLEPDEVVDYFERVTATYAALGADECEARSQRSVDALEESLEAFEDGPPPTP